MKFIWTGWRMLAMAFMLAIGLIAPAQADGLSDAEIIGIYSQVNSFDIETALLGDVKANSEQVRGLGRMVWRDHTGVRKGVHDLAVEIGVTPVLPPARIEAARQHDAVVAGLHALSGEDFDAAYLRHEIAFHRAAIEAVRNLLLPAAQNETLKAHFEAVLPAFEHHLAENIRVAKELNVEFAN